MRREVDRHDKKFNKVGETLNIAGVTSLRDKPWTTSAVKNFYYDHVTRLERTDSVTEQDSRHTNGVPSQRSTER